MESHDRLRSLKRGLKTLTLFADAGMLTVSEVARHIEVPKTTAHSILVALVCEGYIERIPDGYGYRLTPSVQQLSSGFTEDSWVADVAYPLIEQCSMDIKWPLAVTTPRVDRMLVRACTDHVSPFAITRIHPGLSLPMITTTSGHVYLAFSDPVQRNFTLRIIAENFPEFDLNGIEGVLEKIESDGFFLSDRTKRVDNNFSVPVVVDRHIRACVTMRYITSVLSHEEVTGTYLEKLQTISGTIAKSLKNISFS